MVDTVVQDPLTANDLKPTECAGISLTNVINSGGTFNGTPGNDLILGSVGIDVVDGFSGKDCIVGGDQGDQLFGGTGSGPETVLDALTPSLTATRTAPNIGAGIGSRSMKAMGLLTET